MRRSLLILGLAFLAHLPAGGALAQTGGTTGSTALAESDFTIYAQLKTGSASWTDLGTDDLKTTFDRARCLCGSTVRFVVEAADSTAMSKISTLLDGSGADGEGRLYLGQSSTCTTDPNDSSYACLLLDQIDELDGLASKGYWVSTEVSVADLFASAGGSCTSVLTQYLWFWVDTASDGSADLTGGGAPSLSLRLDGKVPSPPTDVAVEAGKEALILGWTASSTATSSSDLAGYLVFCAYADSAPVFATSPYDAQFVSPATLATAGLCPNQDTLDTATFAATFANLDAAYLCSGLIASDQTSYRLKGLENNVAYTVAMVAVDNNGNLSAATDAVTGMPALTVDFYSEYINEGGPPVGGYCAMATGRDRPNAIATLLGGLVALWLAVRRRRRGGAWRLLLLLALSLAAAPAQAQAIFHDDDAAFFATDSTEDSSSFRSPRSVSLEFRLGPYRPDVDAGLANGATPHATMFGSGSHLLYQVELDYELWQGFGTFAVGLGAGYFRETAKAFLGTVEGASTGVRSSDETALSLIPLSVVATYRWDVPVERWRVPVAPYAKLGLNYTFWKVTDGNGEVATTTQGARGAGGTAGWLVTAGLALSLDVLDRGSMRELDAESGLNHMYLFAEWSHVDASGLGMGNRLYVGDTTWNAGLLLEF